MVSTYILAALIVCPPRATLDVWVTRTAQLESSGNVYAVGDGGASLGLYQIQRATWVRYSSRPWHVYAYDRVESRRVCRLILIDCHRACVRHGYRPTFTRVRWYYRHGGF